VLLGFVWEGYDRLVAEVISQVDAQQADDSLETNVTQLLEPLIRRSMSQAGGYLPYDVQHNRFEFATRLDAPAQAPGYDIAFFLIANPRVMWPLEAKVLRTDRAVGAYVGEVTGNFLTCRYAPFSNEAAMLAYLVSGLPQHALHHISESLRCTLTPHPDFPDRDHATSDHRRAVPTGKPYPEAFRCHHLIMPVGGGAKPAAPTP
jgi:hypothetical protein